MKCPKTCTPYMKFMCKTRNFICVGRIKKPSKYKGDVVGLCIKSRFTEVGLEITPDEAVLISSALNMVGLDRISKEGLNVPRKMQKV